MLSSFYPVVAGRTSDASNRYRSLYQVQMGKMGLQDLESQLSSGMRYTLPSQDPTSALRVISLQRELEFRDQTIKNLESSQSYLNATESNLSNVQDLMTELRGLGVEASTNVAGVEERTGWINQIEASITRLQSLANAKHIDRFLFSGGLVGTPTVSVGREGIQYNGNDLSLLTLTDSGDYLAHNVTGQKALGLLSDAVVGRNDLDPIALETTRIADLNQGQGIAPGAIRFSDGTNQVTIDLANTEFVGDILERINSSVTLDGREVSASLVDGRLQFQYADGNPGILRIQEVATGRTAGDLGILTNEPAPTLPIVGQSLNPTLRLTTQLSQLNGGAGFPFGDGLRITQGGRNFDVLFTGAETVEDAINLIHRSEAPVIASITPDGRGLQIKSRISGTDFAVGELNGNLAEALGLRTFHGQTRISELNYGQGMQTVQGADLLIRRNDGTELGVDLDSATTIQDVLDTINNHVDNQVVETRITASLAPTGNGIVLTSGIPTVPIVPDPGPIRIRSAGGSQAASVLGLVPRGQSESTAQQVGSEFVFTGSDPNPQEVRGIFNSLTRLRDAIANQDMAAIARSVQLMDQDLERLSLSRGSLGVEQQRIDNLKAIKEESRIALKADESNQIEADMVSVISQLNARQVSYEASLRLLASANQLSLFNYL